VELRQLRYFVTVAEELHFGRAAERLHIVQSAVSQQVRRLERELGAELLDRSPRHVRLTPAGARFLPEARAVLAAEERARAAVAGFADTRARTLRLGTSAGLGTHLDRVLDAFAALAPDVTVDLVSASSRERLQRVSTADLDAAFVRGAWPPAHGAAELRAAVPTDVDGVCVVPLWADPLVAVLPGTHPLAARPDIGLAELAGQPLRLVPRRQNPPLVDVVVNACHAAGFAPVPGPPAGSLQDSIAAIGAGAALWTVVYASQAAALHAPRVAFLPFRAPGLALTAGLAVRRERPARAVESLLRACARRDDLDS
jgi:DNA-binding transcriptional LysR family regulator